MTTWITICDTCKRKGWEETGMDETDGEKLAALIEIESTGRDVNTRRFSCLMGCEHACNISIQAEGKISYTLGAFEPNSENAKAVVDYAVSHSQSATGQVPYKQWPAAVKGHFITRHQPIPTKP